MPEGDVVAAHAVHTHRHVSQTSLEDETRTLGVLRIHSFHRTLDKAYNDPRRGKGSSPNEKALVCLPGCKARHVMDEAHKKGPNNTGYLRTGTMEVNGESVFLDNYGPGAERFPHEGVAELCASPGNPALTRLHFTCEAEEGVVITAKIDRRGKQMRITLTVVEGSVVGKEVEKYMIYLQTNGVWAILRSGNERLTMKGDGKKTADVTHRAMGHPYLQYAFELEDGSLLALLDFQNYAYIITDTVSFKDGEVKDEEDFHWNKLGPDFIEDYPGWKQRIDNFLTDKGGDAWVSGILHSCRWKFIEILSCSYRAIIF